MSALSIQPVFPTFTDIDGQPLENGYIWIGQANLDPQANPITVYLDNALTIVATQPIRTIAGYPSNNGALCRLYVNTNYSIRVMNKNGSVVYSAPEATERYSNAVLSNVAINVTDFGAIGDGVTDDTIAIQAALNAAGAAKKNVFAPGGQYVISETLYVPAGVTLFGENKYDPWNETPDLGTRFITSGLGNPQRWTDITGGDLANDTPMFVACGNGVYFRNIAFYTDLTGVNAWSMGLFFPCVKQCGFQTIVGDGFTDGAVYLDATWSNRNTTLMALHPEVTPSSGMNEFSGIDFYLRGRGTSGFGLKLQGTTRAGDSVPTANDWLWGYGGISDTRFLHGRLMGTGDQGGCFSHDAQLYGVNVFAQGTTLRDVSLRLSGQGRYCLKCDRTNRLIVDGAYGETVGTTPPEIAVTSRTQASVDGISLTNDKINARVYLDGVPTTHVGSLADWTQTGCISVFRVDGRLSTPNFTGNTNSGVPVQIRSFTADATVNFQEEIAGVWEDYFQINNENVRPAVDRGLALGTGSFRFERAQLAWTTLGQGETQVIASGVITANQTATRVDTEGGAATDDLDTINGGIDGSLLILRTQSNARDVTVKDGTGNLFLSGDCVLGRTVDLLTLYKVGSDWYELSRSIKI